LVSQGVTALIFRLLPSLDTPGRRRRRGGGGRRRRRRRGQKIARGWSGFNQA